jgi:hypothetical protein
MPIFATAGTKLHIGGVIEAKNSDFTQADFDSATWTEIAPLESLGSVGDTSEVINFDAIGYSRRLKLKGVRDAGTMEVVVGIDYADPGQIALLAAEKTPHDYAFRLVFNDAPEGGTPSERLFIAKVMSVSEALDEANSVMRLNASLAVNSNVVRVLAAEA